MKENDKESSVSGGCWNVKWRRDRVLSDTDEALRRAKSMSLKGNLIGQFAGRVPDAERPRQIGSPPRAQGLLV
jgi:hypothetical protein